MKLRLSLIACASMLLPALAAAQVAAKWVNVRAGPDRDYPLVASYGPGTPLSVQGCIDGFTWCDVIGPDGVRGWVYGGNVAYPYENRSVPVYGYGANFGIPIVTFALGAYWGSYYLNRPWYRDRGRWEHHRPPPRPPHGRPPPRPFPGPPIGAGPGGHRPPPGGRPPGDHRPPPGGRPPGDHRPPIGAPGGGRPPGADRPPPRPNPGGGGEGRPPHGGGGGGRSPGEPNRRP